MCMSDVYSARARRWVMALLLISTISEARADVVAVGGDAVVRIPDGGDSNAVPVWFERQTILAVSVDLNHVNPGLVEHGNQLVEGTLPVGTRVRSYMIRFDPQRNNGVSADGWVRLDRPILGVIIGTNRLDDTDDVLGLPSFTYNHNNMRGLELTPDTFQISDDRLQIDFHMQVNNLGTDDIRVVTETRAADANCDGVINNFDIDAFVLAVANVALYRESFPNCDVNDADVNNDGAVNNFDIDAFVQCLVSGCA